MRTQFFRRHLVLASLGFATFFGTTSGVAASAPDWLTAVAKAPVTVATKDADAVRLLDEGVVEIDRDGQRTSRMRAAVKVLNADGRKLAAAAVPYLSDSSTVKSFRAWLISPKGDVKAYAKKETVDVAVHATALELYGEQRQQIIRAIDDASAGAVFGFEAVVVSRRVIHQEAWQFQGAVPTERSSFTLKLAPGWTQTSRFFNHAAVAPKVEGSSFTWTLEKLPPLPNEPSSPPAQTLSPWVAIDLVPAAKSAALANSVKSGSWLELSRFMTPKYDAAARSEPALQAKVRELTASASTPWERVQRLCEFAQRVNYISILLDAGNAGGLIPRPAARVLQCNYGDCKDKSTLLRALLAEIGVKAHPLVVLAESRSRVERDWPSANQFNHCIVAIQVDDRLTSSATLDHPTLGRLLVFDPTDPFTPVGRLGRARLSDDALLLAGEQGGLIELPPARAQGDRIVRTIHASIDTVGNVRGRISVEFLEAAASAARGAYSLTKRDDYLKRVERQLGQTLPALRDVKVQTEDRFLDARFTQNVDFLSLGYGKLMRDELLVFKPALLGRRDTGRFTKKTRLAPIVLRAQAEEEKAEFTLPEDCTVDEIAPPLELETDFGRYRSSTRAEGGKLFYERALELRSREIPAAEYERVKAFFDRISRHEQSAVVLRRQRATATPTDETPRDGAGATPR
jgi:hypothetical protein